MLNGIENVNSLLTLYQTISRSLPSVLKLHLRVTVSPTTTGGRGSMVTVRYPEEEKKKKNWTLVLSQS